MTALTDQPSAALVRRLYDAFNTADIQELTSLLSPDITVLQPGRSSLAGLYKGRDAFFGFFGALSAATGGTFRAQLRDLYANDTQVVAVQHETATRGDARLAADAALVFELSDGVVTAVTVHPKRQQDWDEFFS